MNARLWTVWLAVAVSILLPSCKQKGSESGEAPGERSPAAFPVEKAPSVSAESMAAARMLYGSRCAMCHGPVGRGDGPMAKALAVRPQDLTERLWQSNRSNQRLGLVIVSGGSAIGKSPLMPGQPDLASQPATVEALVALVRGFVKDQ
jgi:mono/diheme cytochrome c family protein